MLGFVDERKVPKPVCPVCGEGLRSTCYEEYRHVPGGVSGDTILHDLMLCTAKSWHEYWRISEKNGRP